MISPILFSKHPISPLEVNKMNQKVDSIILRIRNLERRLMDRGFIKGLTHWNPLLELQVMFHVRQVPNDGDNGGWYVALPTKECVDILNILSKVDTKQQSEYYLSMLGRAPRGRFDPNI